MGVAFNFLLILLKLLLLNVTMTVDFLKYFTLECNKPFNIEYFLRLKRLISIKKFISPLSVLHFSENIVEVSLKGSI